MNIYANKNTQSEDINAYLCTEDNKIDDINLRMNSNGDTSSDAAVWSKKR